MPDLQAPQREQLRRLADDATLAPPLQAVGKRTLTDDQPAAARAAGASLGLAAALAAARRYLDALRAAHAAVDEIASAEAAHQLRLSLDASRRARGSTDDRTTAAGDLERLAAPLLAVAFVPSRAAIDEALRGTGERVHWDGEVAMWRAARGVSAAGAGGELPAIPVVPALAPGRQVPTTDVNQAALKARADQRSAEVLLTARDLDGREKAAQAMEILIAIAPEHRGAVLDALDEAAFDNLLDRVPDDQREHFAALVDASQDPVRKLKLWSEFHKSRADNDLRSRRGDVGKDVPKHPTTNEDGLAVEEEDPAEHDAIAKTWTPEQKINRQRDARRAAAVESTKYEVDVETARLIDKAKAGTLTVADVDAMRARKELEYQIELDYNVNLTAEAAPRQNGDAVQWSVEELEQVRTTLARLPQMDDPDAVSEIHRTSGALSSRVAGMYLGDRIDVYDRGAQRSPSSTHGGQAREMVSDKFSVEHGRAIGTLEYVLTHEIGHDVAKKHPAAFEMFTRAAGWTQVAASALARDHIDSEAVANAERDRPDPNEQSAAITSKDSTRTYTPIANSKDYWAVDKTAIPSQDESTPNLTKPDPATHDTWNYARVDPQEHFAETYAKAVHVPEQLHDELIDRPIELARAARARVDEVKRDRTASNADVTAAEQAAVMADREVKQRGEEFRVMRDDVFGADKAVDVAAHRLAARGVAAEQIAAFRARAERASTPEQVSTLESEMMP